MTTYENVSARALLVSLQISTWSARKYNKHVSDEVTANHAAEKDAGRFNVHLLAGTAAHADVIKHAVAARVTHYGQTLPWADDGWRLLPTSNYMAYTEAMRKARSSFDLARHNFLDEYPALRDQAAVKLGGLYRIEDFPTTINVAQRFAWAIEFQPVPSAGDLRVDLPADQLAAIELSVTDRVESSVRDAMQDAWRRLNEAVARIRKASSDDGIVRSNVIDHARETCDTLARLNVSQDERLEEMRRRVERDLTDIAVEDLRNDDRLRKDTAKRADDILSAMSAFYAPAPVIQQASEAA